MEERITALKEQLAERMAVSAGLSDQELLDCIDELILTESRSRHILLADRELWRKELFDEIRRLDILQELLEEPSVTEIMINGCDEIFVETGDGVSRWNRRFSSDEKLDDVIQRIVSRVNRVVNEKDPIVDARLEDGSRVNIVLPPVALNGPVVTIRKFREGLSMKQMVAGGTLTSEAAKFLALLTASGYNLLISGGTNSGKTTFLNALSGFIPAHERVITIEDSAELKIQGVPNLIRLETRNSNLEGKNGITMDQLIRSALRMRPNRIIVGEVRGGEVLSMLQAMNSGHDGSMSTGHANSCQDMISRLEAMALMGANIPLMSIHSQIASAIEIMLHLGRLPDGRRKLLSVMEVLKLEGGRISLHEVYDWKSDKKTNAAALTARIKRTEKLFRQSPNTRPDQL